MNAEILDRLVAAVPGIRAWQMPPEGWLKTVRKAIGFTQQEIAEYLQIKQSTVKGYEKNEARKALTLGSLEFYAAALNCDVVHVLIPKAGRMDRFSQMADEVAKIHGRLGATPAATPPPIQPTSAPGEAGGWGAKALNAFFKATEDPTNPGPSPEELTRQAMSLGKKTPKK